MKNLRTNCKTIKQKWEVKQLHGYFKRKIREIAHEKTWTRLRMRNLKWETESFLIAAQNNAMRTNYIKATIDNTQQNSKRIFSEDRNETDNHIIRECNKQVQKK